MNRDEIADNLTRMKDMSEAMVNLVQYAFIFNNEEIADHVLEMESRMDKIHLEFQLAVLNLRDESPAEGILGLINLAQAAEKISDAAGKMASLIKKGITAHPIARIALEEAEETIVLSEIKGNSLLVGKSLGEIGFEDDIGMRVIAVKRGDWIFNPRDDFVLNSEDKILARGYVEGREKLLTLTDPYHTHETET